MIADEFSPTVWASVICYQSNLKELEKLCECLSNQVERVLVLDNDNQSELCALASERIRVIPMLSNLGTAGAMNIAWQQAISENVDFMVCFDQDSAVDHDLVRALLSSWRRLEQGGARIGALGPAWTDPRTGYALKALTPTKWRRRRVDASAAPATEVDHLITSGCLISTRVIQDIGLFNTDLFLDYVDIEWSLRARHHGFRFYVTREAKMDHRIGERVLSVMGRSLWVHHPNRHYFLVRNHILLWRLRHISLPWKIRDGMQVMIKIFLLVLLASPRLTRMGWAVRGIWDGLRGRTGPIM